MLEHNLRSNYYTMLGLNPAASPQKIRQVYRELSKLYHPDTTELPEAIATAKFQDLNEAYGTLSSPERRATYDLRIGYSRVSVVQPRADLNRPVSESRKARSSSAYLDPVNRPLSAGEIFALFILGVTFVGCLILVFTIGFTRGDTVQAFVSPDDIKAFIQNVPVSPNHQADDPALDSDDGMPDSLEDDRAVSEQEPRDRSSDAKEDVPLPVEAPQTVSPEAVVEQFSFPAQPLTAPDMVAPEALSIPSLSKEEAPQTAPPDTEVEQFSGAAQLPTTTDLSTPGSPSIPSLPG